MKIHILITITFVFSTCISCIKAGGPCEEPLNVNQSEVIVIFKNTTERYLYEEINPLYNKDSLKVYDQYGNGLFILSKLNQIPNTSMKYLELSFGNIYDNSTDQSSFNSEICKDFLIKYTHNETDNLTVCFKSKKTKCGSIFETLKVYHNGQLLANISNDTYALITLIKP
jgi:hypothetical protein